MIPSTVEECARYGAKLMRQAKVHPHFFEGNSLFKNALYLSFFSLNLPYEYNNKNYLQRKITEQEAFEIIKLFERRIKERYP